MSQSVVYWDQIPIRSPDIELLMTDLQIRLFGSPSIQQAQEPVTGFISSKATALVYYLAATRRTHGRDSLAALFWADVAEARAKKNLRDVLSNLRKVIGPHLEITRQTVALTVPLEAVDVCQFEALLSSARDRPSNQQRVDSLKNAAALQRGEFLEGFYVAEAPLFEEWVLTERERYGQLALQVFNDLIADAMHSGNNLDGIDYALRSLALAPLEEATHRQLMTLYAAKGQYAAALEQYEQCCQILYDELGAEPSVKTTELFESIQARQENPQPKRIADDHLLPFVGRTKELTEISRLLASSDCRLLTLVGLGGVGKSRLARQVAIRNEHRFLDGTYLISLVPHTSTEQFVTHVASAVGLPLSVDGDVVVQLLNYLSAKSMLIIIDNAEVLLESSEMSRTTVSSVRTAGQSFVAVEVLGMMVGSAPGLKLIATSREHLGLRSEWLFEVSGLMTPPPLRSDLDFAPDSAAESFHDRALLSDAVQLFLKRGRQAWVDFPQVDEEISQSELVAIGRVCQLVEGMPLAIELAAGWVSMLSCREIMREIMNGIDLLASTARDLPERHRSLQAIFDHSCQMLTPDQKEILEKLSVFQGGFTRVAAQQVAGATLPVLQTLAQRSFLSRSGRERFVLHNLLQQYALRRLDHRPQDLIRTQERHAQYSGRLLELRRDAVVAEQAEIIASLADEEIDNLRAGYEWALANERFDLLDQMLDGLYYIYAFRSWLAEGIGRFKRAVNSLHKIRESSDAKLSDDDSTETQRMAILGRVNIRLGRLLQLLGRHEESQRHLADGLAWAEAAGEASERALCMLGQANVYYELADYERAEDLYHQSLSIYQRQQNRIGSARTFLHLGRNWLAKGEYSLARQNLIQALDLAQAIQLRSTEAECYWVLGQICWNQGDHSAAQQCFERALDIFRLRSMTNALSEAKVLNELGFVAWSQGLYDQAYEHHVQARQIFRRIGNRQGEGNTFSHLGRVAERRKQYEEASQLYERALIINREIHDRQGEAISHANLAFVAFREGNFALAEGYFTECHELCHTIGFRRYEALAAACLGLLACFRLDYAAGMELAQASLDLAWQIHDPIMEAYGWNHLGYALSGQLNWKKANAAYERGLALRRRSKGIERLLDPLSGLAYIALQRNDIEAAQLHVDEIIGGLNAHTIANAMLPAQVYYCCYAVLAHHGKKEADQYLQRAVSALSAATGSSSSVKDQAALLSEPLVYKKIMHSVNAK